MSNERYDACRHAEHCDEDRFDLSNSVSIECSNSLRYDSVIHGVVSHTTRICINNDVRTSGLEKESNALFPNKFLLLPSLKW
jgi:hypothetical protein